jgi:hypothetical protein
MTPNLVDSVTELDASNSMRLEFYSQHVNPIWVKAVDVLGLQICANNFMVLKAAPPLVVSELLPPSYRH